MNYSINKSLERFKQTISASTSPFHTAAEAMRQLREAGFASLGWEEDWHLEKGGKYFICPYGTTVFAFTIGKNIPANPVIKAASAHIDNPGLRIKYKPDLSSKNGHRLNTEVYGGAIYSTWFDRPLSIAGRIAVKSGNPYEPHMELLDFKRSVMTIPNLAIHLNRKVNEGISINAQTDLLPICASGTDNTDEQEFLLTQLADELNIKVSDILCYELCVYNCEQPQCTGFAQDILMAPRIDNLSSIQACITGLCESDNSDTINIISLYDHEEIGSHSKNGAGSSMFTFLMERICRQFAISREDFLKNLTKNYYLSLDVAHAVNPSHAEKSDLTTAMPLNQGFAIKCSAKQAYCTEDKTLAVLMSLAAQHNIACQPNHMRSDIPGGSTVGPIVTAAFPVNSADIGIPIYAMHSAMETAGVKDQFALEEFMKVYFS